MNGVAIKFRHKRVKKFPVVKLALSVGSTYDIVAPDKIIKNPVQE